jgi:oxygen-independent coproporphyrinogen-3 oxidase
MTPALISDIPRELIQRFEQSGGEAISFPPAVNGRRLTSFQYADSLRAVAQRPDELLGVYIHLPFCPVRCLYCACHTTITHDGEKIDRYLDTLEREMELATGVLGSGRALSQLHVGGGSPNYLSDSQLIRLMEMIDRHFGVRPETITSMECNPRRASAGQLELLKGLGFKGVSFGIQDLDARVQQAIGRINSLGLVRDVVVTAREIGFETVGLDLVYGLPYQTEQGFEETLERIIETGPDRVRCYSYSHRPSARPHQYAIEAGSLPGPAEKLALLHQAVRSFTDSGYHWIGVDWFVRDGDDLSDAQAAGSMRHTCLGYTSAPTHHVLPLGTSSLGEVDGAFVQNEPTLDAWRRSVDQGQFPIYWGHKMSDTDLRRRAAIQHLMCHLELPEHLVKGIEQDYERLSRCAEYGLVEVLSDRIRVTPRGRYFLRSICTQHEVSVAWTSNQWGVPQIN